MKTEIGEVNSGELMVLDVNAICTRQDGIRFSSRYKTAVKIGHVSRDGSFSVDDEMLIDFGKQLKPESGSTTWDNPSIEKCLDYLQGVKISIVKLESGIPALRLVKEINGEMRQHVVGYGDICGKSSLKYLTQLAYIVFQRAEREKEKGD